MNKDDEFQLKKRKKKKIGESIIIIWNVLFIIYFE